MTKTTELAFATLLLGVAVLAATATTEDPALPRLARLRLAAALSAAAVIADSLLRPVADIAVGTACLGLLLSVLAVWLDRLRAVREQAWHDQFELPFAEYVRERRPGTGS